MANVFQGGLVDLAYQRERFCVRDGALEGDIGTWYNAYSIVYLLGRASGNKESGGFLRTQARLV